MSWLAVRIAGASSAARDAISAALIGAGAAGVQEDRDALITYLPDDAPLDAVRSVVAAPWLAHNANADDIVVVIDPAMAFGTGEHPTTRGALRLMQKLIRPGDRVADLGAGSAVLSIAAAKLGASRVAAIENDSDAIGNAEANVVANGVGDRVVVIEGDAATLLPHIAPVRVILANIISSVLEAL